jgi:hypothetical protein
LGLDLLVSLLSLSDTADAAVEGEGETGPYFFCPSGNILHMTELKRKTTSHGRKDASGLLSYIGAANCINFFFGNRARERKYFRRDPLEVPCFDVERWRAESFVFVTRSLYLLNNDTTTTMSAEYLGENCRPNNDTCQKRQKKTYFFCNYFFSRHTFSTTTRFISSKISSKVTKGRFRQHPHNVATTYNNFNLPTFVVVAEYSLPSLPIFLNQYPVFICRANFHLRLSPRRRVELLSCCCDVLCGFLWKDRWRQTSKCDISR